jgi:hypothetical protein
LPAPLPARFLVNDSLDHDAIKWNRIMILSLCLSMIFSENRFPLCANAALRVRIMLEQLWRLPALAREFDPRALTLAEYQP